MKGCEIVLPIDVIIAEVLQPGAPCQAVEVAAVPSDRMILDCGPQTAVRIVQRLEAAATLVFVVGYRLARQLGGQLLGLRLEGVAAAAAHLLKGDESEPDRGNRG